MVPATPTQNALEIERVLVQGDIGKMPPEMRLEYYRTTCESLGLNPLTKPFEYLTLQGKTILYAKKDATDQLRKIHGVSINIVSREVLEGVYIVTARGTDKHGRQDESIGALPLPASPVERANAIMKCETKAKRRVTLSICGLGMLDETELETIGSKEAQQEYLRSKGIHPKDAGMQPSAHTQDVRTASEQHKALIVETAKMLDEPPQTNLGIDAAHLPARTERATPVKSPITSIEMRHTATVAEADAQLKEVAKPKRKRGQVSFDVLKHFGIMKQELRDATGYDSRYYMMLREAGYEHADEIKDNDQAREIYRKMGEARKQASQEKDLLELLGHSSEVMGSREFAQFLGMYGAETIPDVLALSGDALAALLKALKIEVDERNTKS